MSIPVKPIFLFADSQLLFWRDEDRPWLERVRREVDAARPKAAYVGASNGDQPEFYDLFRGAMESVGVTDCRMIPTEPSEEDVEYFGRADLVMLAGGEVRRGWRAFKKNGLRQKVIERYYAGAVLMGVSAGAVQLGLYGFHQDEESGKLKVFETFKLVPALIDVHDEPDWARLQRCLIRAGEDVRGLGIPSGAGAVLHQDLTLEPVRRSLVELAQEEGEVKQSLIFPPGEDGGDEIPPDATE
ncbi:MAG TPA: Type 1 glutamine amidotransferase-like domain-containing protein [Thermoanaerobaculia bacterium]